jgi:hypothetical protein
MTGLWEPGLARVKCRCSRFLTQSHEAAKNKIKKAEHEGHEADEEHEGEINPVLIPVWKLKTSN